MKFANYTYRFIIYLLFAGTLYSCAVPDNSVQDAKEMPKSVNAEVESVAENSMTEEAIPGASKPEQPELNLKQWKKKAKQQLESVQDLALILQDSSLDELFRIEIQKELQKTYDFGDTTMYSIMQPNLNFKKFQGLKIANGDTLSLDFKNQKEQLQAKFILVTETKSFGKTSELVKRLKLISIVEKKE